MKAEIITIGDELLIGQIVDTNSAWMAEQFNAAGIEVYQITSVHDDHEHIKKALKQAEKEADIIVLTGGLGPTKDDITRKTLCEYFNTRLILHQPTLDHIKNRFLKRNIDLNRLNQEQALVPESCTILYNEAGTAPGMWFERNNTIYVSLPGVPFEMKYLIEHQVLPRLQTNGKIKAIFHKTVLTIGLPESMLAERIEQWESALPSHIRLAYLPNPMSVRLRLSAMGLNKDELKSEVDKQIGLLRSIIPDHIFGFDNETLAEVTGTLLKSEAKSLSVAESCTGGYISHLLTLVPGSSAYYTGGVTAYSNTAKEKLLGVNPESIHKYGAVSEQVAIEMALGAKNKFGSDYSIATTGIAGPDGGSDAKPVGTIWIAVAGASEIKSKKFLFGDNRERNIIRSSHTALQMLRSLILEGN